ERFSPRRYGARGGADHAVGSCGEYGGIARHIGPCLCHDDHHRTSDHHLPAAQESRQEGPSRARKASGQGGYADDGRHHDLPVGGRHHAGLQHGGPALDAASGRGPDRGGCARGDRRPHESRRWQAERDDGPLQVHLAQRVRARCGDGVAPSRSVWPRSSPHVHSILWTIRYRLDLCPDRRVLDHRDGECGQPHRWPRHAGRRHGGDRILRVRNHRLPPGPGRCCGVLLHDGRVPGRFSLVQRSSRTGHHGRHRRAGDRGGACYRGVHDRTVAPVASGGRSVRGRDRIGHDPGLVLQSHEGQANLPNDAAASPFRAVGVVGDAGHDALLDRGNDGWPAGGRTCVAL
ncbi:MAG: Phospho-N-acetylmuramoyl-pentapeptide-transferase, partial [uncultured Thermomicrobiales bacterium]